ncbi:MAG: helix-turn-helix domain-containing protein [Pseudomonadota bacterium]
MAKELKRVAGKTCDISNALKVIGDRWALLVIRDLFFAAENCCRFTDFQRTIEGVNPATLSKRLQSLEEAGLVQRKIYTERPPRAVYHLTEAGKDLKPVLLAMMEWGRRHAGPDSQIELDKVTDRRRGAKRA